MMFDLLVGLIAAVALLALLTGLAIMAKWRFEFQDQLRVLLGSLLGVLILLISLLFVLRP